LEKEVEQAFEGQPIEIAKEQKLASHVKSEIWFGITKSIWH